LDEFCTKANITGYAKIVFDAVNKTVIEQSSAGVAAAKTAFSYNATANSGSVIFIQNFLKFPYFSLKFFH